jgi:membrane protease YdiL (CAAX protease family)
LLPGRFALKVAAMTPELATATLAQPPAAPGRSRRLRYFELALVLFIAFARPILTSTYIAIYGIPSHGSASPGWISMFLDEIGALLVLWYVLQRSNRSFLNFGIRARLRDCFAGLVLVAGFLFVYYLTYTFLQVGHKLSTGAYVVLPDFKAIFPKGGFAVLPFVLLNPFFEEFIVRGYLMIEVADLSGSMVAAVLVSTAIQTSYHTYQGWLLSTCLFFCFLLLSVYYARTQKLFPVLVAHALWDWFFAVHFFLGGKH